MSHPLDTKAGKIDSRCDVTLWYHLQNIGSSQILI